MDIVVKKEKEKGKNNSTNSNWGSTFAALPVKSPITLLPV